MACQLSTMQSNCLKMIVANVIVEFFRVVCVLVSRELFPRFGLFRMGSVKGRLLFLVLHRLCNCSEIFKYWSITFFAIKNIDNDIMCIVQKHTIFLKFIVEKWEIYNTASIFRLTFSVKHARITFIMIDNLLFAT